MIKKITFIKSSFVLWLLSLGSLWLLSASQVTFATVYHAFSYQDNAIVFYGEPRVLKFHLTEFSITAGQDPDKHIIANTLYPYQYNGFHFVIGRQKTSPVANWFSASVHGRNTFWAKPNPYPQALNFALMGNLVLSDEQPSEEYQAPYTFNDIVLAQGSTIIGLKKPNNWWFGGKHCLPTPVPGSIECLGKDSSGKSMTLIFHRADDNSQYNDVHVSKPSTSLCLSNKTLLPLAINFPDFALPSITTIEPGASYCQRFAQGSKISVKVTNSEDPTLNGQFISKQPSQATERHVMDNKALASDSKNNLDYVLQVLDQTNHYTLFDRREPQLDTVNWMKNIPDDTPLNAIIMPASHDAGMSRLVNCSALATPALVQTQARPIAEQAAAGSRYFDIRIDYDKQVLITYHRTGGAGCSGESLGSILDGAKRFLTANPTETLFFKFSHTRNSNGHHPATITAQVINFLTNNIKGYLYASKDINLAQTDLASVRGKIVAVFDDEYKMALDEKKLGSKDGFFAYHDKATSANKAPACPLNQTESGLNVYDCYSDTNDLTKMQADQRKKLSDHGGLNQPFLFLFSYTLTPKGPTDNIKTLADTAKSHLPAELNAIKDYLHMPNFVYIDYLDSNAAKTIICYNPSINKLSDCPGQIN